jgi:hypothetical protein
MRSLCLQVTVTLLALTLAGAASAQEETELKGLLSVSFAHSYQMGDLDVGGNLDDGVGLDVAAGFQAGEHLAFLLGYEWQTNDDYDTHYFPVSVRVYSPLLLDRLRLYGTVGVGVFFTRVHNEFNPNGNDRAAAFHTGGGFSVDVSEELGLLVYLKYQRGLGQVDDFESLVPGVGFEYRWGL